MSIFNTWANNRRRSVDVPATTNTFNAEFFDQFDRAISNVFNDGFYVQPHRTSHVGPQSYVATDEAEHRISLALPGVPKEAVNVNIGDGTLIVGYEATSDDYNSAIFSTSFTKSWTLPEGVDVEGITASSENGVLTISVPRTETKASEGRTITVK